MTLPQLHELQKLNPPRARHSHRAASRIAAKAAEKKRAYVDVEYEKARSQSEGIKRGKQGLRTRLLNRKKKQRYDEIEKLTVHPLISVRSFPGKIKHRKKSVLK